MIGKRLQPGFPDGFGDAPERIAREHRRGALYYQKSLCAQVPRYRSIKSRGIQLSQRVIRRIREINQDESTALCALITPWESVCVNNMQARRRQRFLVKTRQHGLRGK